MSELSVPVLESIPKWVMMRGVVYPGHEKAPFVKSGHGANGCIAYRPEEDKLQCHECGEWFQNLASHIRKHALSPREYRVRHGLRQRTPLVGECTREKNRKAYEDHLKTSFSDGASQRGRDLSRVSWAKKTDRKHTSREVANERGNCQAQLLARLTAIKNECGDVTTTEMARRGIHLSTVLYAFNLKSWRDVRGMLELAEKPGEKHTRNYLIESLRDFYVAHGRPPKSTEMGYGSLPVPRAYSHHFGSMNEAMDAAGLGVIWRATHTGKRGRPRKDATVPCEETRPEKPPKKTKRRPQNKQSILARWFKVASRW